MPTGSLRIFCGPMFAGKTSHLCHQFYKLRSGGHKPLIIKPRYDDRYGVEVVVSHDGLKAEAHPISSFDEILDVVKNAAPRHVLIDECQFFDDTRYVSANPFHVDIHSLMRKGIDISCFGLDTDWRGHPFIVTANLLAMADTVTKLTAFCAVCGEPATKTGKIRGGDESVEVGGRDSYEARCRAHWAPEKLQQAVRP